MVKRYTSIFTLLIVLFLGLILAEGFANAQAPEVTIETLSNRPEAYLDQEVVVSGKLIVIGDYWRYPKFVIVDGKGNRFPVPTFAPLEVVPPPPHEDKKLWAKKRPRLMSDYLDENLLIRGKVEAKRGKRISEIEGEYYLRPTKEIKVLDEYWEGGTIK